MLDALVAEARVRWGLEPAAGLQIVAAERLTGFPVDAARPLIVAPLAFFRGATTGGAAGGEAAPLPGRNSRAEGPAETLRRLYPADHAVGRFGQPGSITVGELDDAALATAVYVAPLAPELAWGSPWALPWMADRLRKPDGCPWDREQTHQSLKKHLLEEAYEVYDALDAGATPELAGELGDLLLQIVLHAEFAAEEGVFDITDVYDAIDRKILRRHPHVFGDAEAKTASDVNRQWEQIKRAEREEAAAGVGDGIVASALDGISSTMPALAATQEASERAAHLGYDWPDVDGVIAKIHEELAELADARTPAEKREELGDLLLVVVNLARKEGVDAEPALRAANEKFRSRFRRVERMARERNVLLRDMSFDELDALWDAAKAEQRAEQRAEERAESGKEPGDVSDSHQAVDEVANGRPEEAT